MRYVRIAYVEYRVSGVRGAVFLLALSHFFLAVAV